MNKLTLNNLHYLKYSNLFNIYYTITISSNKLSKQLLLFADRQPSVETSIDTWYRENCKIATNKKILSISKFPFLAIERSLPSLWIKGEKRLLVRRRRVWRRRNGTEEAAERCGREGEERGAREGEGRPGRRDREGQGSRVVRHSPDLRPYPLPELFPRPRTDPYQSYLELASTSCPTPLRDFAVCPRGVFRFVPIRRKKKEKRKRKDPPPPRPSRVFIECVRTTLNSKRISLVSVWRSEVFVKFEFRGPWHSFEKKRKKEYPKSNVWHGFNLRREWMIGGEFSERNDDRRNSFVFSWNLEARRPWHGSVLRSGWREVWRRRWWWRWIRDAITW